MGMSQIELARAIEVSSSTISQVEGGQILLSLPALIRAAKVLDVSLDTLVNPDGEAETSPILQKEQRSPVRLSSFGDSEIVAYALNPGGPLRNLEAYELHIQPGAQLNGHFFISKGEEFGYLLEGVLQVQVEGAESRMHAGDGIHLVTEMPDRWANPLDSVARMLWVMWRKEPTHGA
jgi:transcriptional regulator with XRE-family HTH domain